MSRFIDLDKELAEILDKEELLAFFDFQFALNDHENLSGLCKISQPKAQNAKAPYYTFLFVVDVPEGRTWQEVDVIMAKIEWDQLKRYLAHTESVMSLPILKSIKGVYIRETYVYVKAPKEPLTSFLLHQLYPGVVKTAGLKAGELAIWKDMSEVAVEKRAFQIPLPSKSKAAPTFLERLKNLLG